MGDELDVDALLEAPFNDKDGDHRNGKSRTPDRKSREKRSRSRDRKRRSRSRSRDRRREKRRSRSRDRERERDRKRSRSRDRKRSRTPERKRKSRSRSRDRRRSRSPRKRTPPVRERSPQVVLTPEERDARTIFVMQLSQRCRARDIEEFFSSVGKIRDVRLILCNKTRRFKGIAYVEFKDIESVALALGLNGQKLLGIPVIVQPSQAEKNRTAQMNERLINKTDKGPMRLYVGSLHFNITEDMLRGIFEPFGRIQSISLMIDQETGRSKGYGFVTYWEAEDAKKALEQMNGFELAGRPMKVGHVTEKLNEMSMQQIGNGSLEFEELDRSGIDLGATGRLALMAKLAAGTGLKLPEIATQALNQSAMMSGNGNPSVASVAAAAHSAMQQQQQQLATMNPPIATQCFLLSNMFDPATETAPNWDLEIRDDVIDECSRHGGVLHIYVDKMAPQGNVYVKCVSIASAVGSVNALHGRWFAGRVITAAYVPIVNYHNLFPDSAMATTLLTTRR